MPPAFPERHRLKALDAARGGAAVIVLLEHALHTAVPAYRELSVAHFMVGEAAIFVFFMISGFVVPMSMEEGRSLGNFWARRVFRLMPIYWLSVATAFLCFPLGLPGPSGVAADDGPSWLANAFLLQSPLNRPAVLGVYWSLYYELGLYAVFTALAAARLLGRTGVWAILGFLVFRALPFSTWTKGTPAVLTYHQTILLAIVFGYLCYRRLTGRFSNRTFALLSVAVLAVPTVRWAVNAASLPGPHPTDLLVRWTATLALACGTFGLLLALPGRWMPRPLLWFGRRSYPLYLLHPLAQSLVWAFGWPTWAFLAASTAVTVLFSDLAHRLVERPAIRLGRWLEQRAVGTAEATAPKPMAVAVEARRAA